MKSIELSEGEEDEGDMPSTGGTYVGTDGGEEAGWSERHWNAGDVGGRPWLNS